MQIERRRLTCLALTLALFGVGMVFLQSSALGQDRASASLFPEGTDPDGPDRLTRIEQHLHQLESHNQHLQKRFNDLTRKYERLLHRSSASVFGLGGDKSASMGIPDGLMPPATLLQGNATRGRQTSRDGIIPRIDGKRRGLEGEEEQAKEGEEAALRIPLPTPRRRRQTGVSGAGEVIESVPPDVIADYVEKRGPYQPDMEPAQLPVAVWFREGLQFRAAHDLLTLEFHNLTQVDYRAFSQTGAALHDNFIIPRQRWNFQGQVTPYVYYYTTINRGYGNLDLLDSWADFNFAPQYKQQLQFRIGRMKTPYTYEYMKVSPSDLIAPERSLFVTNFANNRQEGIMAHGYLFENLLEYYGGVFNGPRRSFQGFNNSKALFAMVNVKPFLHSGFEWLQNLNITGSVNGGNLRAPVQPVALTTCSDQSTANSAALVNVSPTFLIFNSKAFENGQYMQWGTDVAYYYNSFTLLANYEGGFQNYGLQGPTPLPSAAAYGPFASGAFVGVGSPKRTKVPLTGWSVAVAYFLTGEQITRRVYLTGPKRPFGFYNGRLNPGAIEAFFRFSNLQLGDQIFSGGIANGNEWANRVSTTDLGINWYLNHYVRLSFDWQHAFYNRPVFMSDTNLSRHNDLFWFRTQIFF